MKVVIFTNKKRKENEIYRNKTTKKKKKPHNVQFRENINFTKNMLYLQLSLFKDFYTSLYYYLKECTKHVQFYKIKDQKANLLFKIFSKFTNIFKKEITLLFTNEIYKAEKKDTKCNYKKMKE